MTRAHGRRAAATQHQFPTVSQVANSVGLRRVNLGSRSVQELRMKKCTHCSSREACRQRAVGGERRGRHGVKMKMASEK